MTRDQRKMKNQDMIRPWTEGLIRDCRAGDLSPHTVKYYRAGLADSEKYTKTQNVIEIDEIIPDLIRAYLLQLRESAHNPRRTTCQVPGASCMDELVPTRSRARRLAQSHGEGQTAQSSVGTDPTCPPRGHTRDDQCMQQQLCGDP